MKLSKLKKIHIIIIGSVLCVIAGVALFFLQIKPQQEAYKAAEGRYTQASQLGCQAGEDKARKDLQDAINKANTTQVAFNAEMRRRMPDLSFARRDLGMLQLWREQIKTLGPLLENYAHDKSVQLYAAGFDIPAPPANPNDQVFDQDVLVFPLGSIVVVGNFKSVMANVTRWNDCRRLVMVGPPQLGGSSPRLAASYSLKCFVFPASKGGEKIPMAGGGTAVAGQPGGMPAAPMAGPAPVAAPGPTPGS